MEYLREQSSEIGAQSPQQPSASSSQASRKEPSLSHQETPKFYQEEKKNDAVESVDQPVFIQD